MNYTVRFAGDVQKVKMAVLAMQDFNSILPPPSEIGIHKLVPISEDYLYYLLSERGEISKRQGLKSLERFRQETATMEDSIVRVYQDLAHSMLEYYDKYGACVTEIWKMKFWGAVQQPDITLLSEKEVVLKELSFVPHKVIDIICQKYQVRAQINAAE